MKDMGAKVLQEETTAVAFISFRHGTPTALTYD